MWTQKFKGSFDAVSFGFAISRSLFGNLLHGGTYLF